MENNRKRSEKVSVSVAFSRGREENESEECEECEGKRRRE